MLHQGDNFQRPTGIGGTPLHHSSRLSLSNDAQKAVQTGISNNTSRNGISRLFSIRKKQQPVPIDELQRRVQVTTSERRIDEPLVINAEPPNTLQISKGVEFPSISRPVLQSKTSSLSRSQSLLSSSTPKYTYNKTSRPRQQSLSASNQPTKSLQDSTSVLHTHDLNKSSNPAIVSTSSSFPSFLRKASRHTRAKTVTDLDNPEQATNVQLKSEGRSRKLSLSGLNFFKSHSTKVPTTPEIEMWKENNASQKEEDDANLHYIKSKNMIHNEVKDAETDERKAGPTFVSGLNAISSGWTRGYSDRSSPSSTKRKPVPPLDLSAITNAEYSLDSPLPSFHDNHRPYSLISTDTDGNDTPIVRLRKLIVDTKESEEDLERQNRLFFRPFSSGTTSPDAEVIQDQQSPDASKSQSDAGIIATEMSGQSSNSSTLNVRMISAQMQLALQQQRQEAKPSRPSVSPSFHLGLQDDNQLQYQQRQFPRSNAMTRELTSNPISVFGPTRGLLSARPSSEVKRESVVSSRTDSSVHEAVLVRATSTRLHSVPLRHIKVEEWAQKLALSEKNEKGMGYAEDANKATLSSDLDEIPDIPDEPTSSRDDVTSAHLQSKVETYSEQRVVPNQHSSSNLSEAARLGTSPSKRLRTEEILKKDTHSKIAEDDVPESQQTMETISRGEKVESTEVKQKERKREGSRNKEDSNKKEKHRRGHSQGLSNKKSYLTSEEAATAKRKEQEEREQRSRERRQTRELAKQEAYAEKKRNDPLLKMRLALVGLSTEDNMHQVKSSGIELHPLKYADNSAMAQSKTSFHTAYEEEEAEEAMPDEDLEKTPVKQQHRRNQQSTASTMTVMTHDRSSSIGTLANNVTSPSFPLPPLRHDAPTKADDGTILARARLKSHDPAISPQTFSVRNSWSAKSKAPTKQQLNNDDDDDATVLLDVHQIPLSPGVEVRNFSAKIQQPAFVDEQEQYNRESDARLRRSQVPEVFDRFSLQSFVN